MYKVNLSDIINKVGDLNNDIHKAMAQYSPLSHRLNEFAMELVKFKVELELYENRNDGHRNVGPGAEGRGAHDSTGYS